MISYLQGTLAGALPTQVVVEAGGVGYEVLIPLSSYDRLPQPGQPVKILTHLVVREDAHILFGFMTESERDIFRLLVQYVSGIGPKTALAVLSGMSIPAFKSAVAGGDVKALSQIRGVGRKTAERLIVDLRDRIGEVDMAMTPGLARVRSPDEQKLNDAALALVSLGYKQADAQKCVQAAAEKLEKTAALEVLVREALRQG
ncbi:MAG: Holliday junction branch migration protein RuvA [Verrucomicrobiae bacterium]|nr:Holliday junction branch migration protein RuvA [Verrucomicrobiae bacterium]